MRGAIDENDSELFHDPADDRARVCSSFFANNPAHLRGCIERQHAARSRPRMPEWFTQSNGLSRRDELAPHNVEHRMPEKQADPADPPADPVPERHHPSFLLHDGENFRNRLLNGVPRGVQLHRVAAQAAGAQSRARSPACRAASCRAKPSRSLLFSPFVLSAPQSGGLARSSGACREEDLHVCALRQERPSRCRARP